MYEGELAVIPLGSGGLLTDDPHTSVPLNKLFEAKNVILLQGRIEKAPGSHRWNDISLGVGVIQFKNWKPRSYVARAICVGSDGKVYRFKHQFAPPTEVLGGIDDPLTLTTSEFVTMIEGGAEETRKDRKLFILTGHDKPQVISGDGTTRTTMENPAFDWDGLSNPIGGIIHKSRLACWAEHTLYFSLATDHEDFTTAPLQFPVYPGESERIISCFEYKGRLFILKDPGGLYFIDTSSVTTANWAVSKLNDDFGCTSVQGTIAVKDDVLVANSEGSVTSVVAADTLGDIKSADVFASLHMEEAITNEMEILGGKHRFALYHKQGRRSYFSYKSKAGTGTDRLVVVNHKMKSPEAVIWDKDSLNCLNLIDGPFNTTVPAYGSDDGYIYQMEQEDRDVNGSGYRAEFKTHYLDFGQGDLVRAELVKQFDFVEFVYVPTGNFDVTYEIYIDGEFRKSDTFKVKGKSTLGEIKTDTGRTSAMAPLSEKESESLGQGRRISIRCYNETLGQNFSLVRLNVYYRYLETQQTVK